EAEMRVFPGMLAVFLLSAVVAADDEVKLKNGDRLTGKVTSLAGGKLELETTHSGPLKIDWAQVVSVKTDNPIKVRMITNEIFEGKLSPGENGRLKIETQGAAAPIEVDLPKVMFFNQPPTQWHGSITASAKATDGNTHVKSFLIAGEGTRETEGDLFFLRAIFRYAKTSGLLTERNGYGIGKYNLKITPDFYAYVSEELLSDRFKDIRIQTITSIGLGYVFLKQKEIDFAAEAGFAYITNDFLVANDESHPGARISAKLRVALPFGFELKDIFTIYPIFKHSQDYQIRNEA